VDKADYDNIKWNTTLTDILLQAWYIRSVI
jgi:hypothetical protein